MSDPRTAMPETWFTVEINDATATKDPRAIARACGDAIANSPGIVRLIERAIEFNDTTPASGRPSLARAIQQKIAQELEPGLRDEAEIDHRPSTPR
jgi:hypothetical protein